MGKDDNDEISRVAPLDVQTARYEGTQADNLSNDADFEKHGGEVVHLQRRLKSRHLQMIAIGESPLFPRCTDVTAVHAAHCSRHRALHVLIID